MAEIEGAEIMPFFAIAEPSLLKIFRTENPAATWNDLKKSEHVNLAVKTAVPQKTGGLCLYCEQRIIPKLDAQIEHFYPKDQVHQKAGDPNWGISWDNLYSSCLGGTARISDFHHTPNELPARVGVRKTDLSCGQRKKSRLPSAGFLPPTSLPNDASLFSYKFGGGIASNEVAAFTLGLAVEAIDIHIELLNLNCNRLKFARKQFEKYIDDEFDAAVAATAGDFSDVDDLIAMWVAKNKNGLFQLPFISMLIFKFKAKV